MKKKLVILFSALTLMLLAGATPALAGGFSFGFSFGYSSHPAYGYAGYYPVPRTYVYRAYPPPYFYAAPVVPAPYYYVPYRHRVVTTYRAYPKPRAHGRQYGRYVPRRYFRH